eukprot:jgi/Mesen1/5861/ME000298S05130
MSLMADIQPARADSVWPCAVGAVGQFALAAYMKRRGDGGALMPMKAFAVASLIVGGGAFGLLSLVQASGVRSVDDAKAVGRSIRSAFGLPPHPDET